MIRANLGGNVVFKTPITGVASNSNQTSTFSNVPADAKYALVVAQASTAHCWFIVDLTNTSSYKDLDLDSASMITNIAYSNNELIVTTTNAPFASGSENFCFPITGDIDISAIPVHQ